MSKLAIGMALVGGCRGDSRSRGIDLCDFANRDVYGICWACVGVRRMAVVVVYWRLLGGTA